MDFSLSEELVNNNEIKLLQGSSVTKNFSSHLLLGQ